MALSANSVFEVHTGGSDTNGGGFVTGASGSDYSLVDAKRTATGINDSTTDAVANGTSTITSATAAFTSAIIGNIIYLQGGTGALAAGRYQVLTNPNATSITVDRTVAAGNTITMNIGGAVASLGILGSTTATILVDGNKIYIKAGTYTIASATNNIATGCFSKGLALYIEGYNGSRGDLGTPPLLQASGISTFTIISTTGAMTLKNVNFDGAALTSSRAVNFNGIACVAYKCSAVNCTNNGFLSAGSGAARFFYCSATGCSTQAAFQASNFYNCVAYSNTVTGFRFANLNNGCADRCLSYSNSGATSDGFLMDSGSDALLMNCVAYANGRSGYNVGAVNVLMVNCIAESNTGSGFEFGTSNPRGGVMFNCAGFSAGTNVSLGTGTFVSNNGFVTATGSVFTAVGSGDFSLNTTAARGAACRAAGIPGVFPVGLTTGYLDIGAAQHQDPASSGGASAYVF